MGWLKKHGKFGMQDIPKRIDNRQPAREESILHVFGQQQGTAGFGRRGDDQRIPELQLVIDDQIGSGQRRSGFRRRTAESLGKFEQDRTRILRARASAAQHDEKFAQRLRRSNKADLITETPDQISNLLYFGVIARVTTDAGEISQDIGIKGDAGHS